MEFWLVSSKAARASTDGKAWRDLPKGIPTGKIVASPEGALVSIDRQRFNILRSTNGGTDEQIDIVLPMDGTWTLYVHGWQTAGPSADFTMYDWTISATPGGNMSVDAAPAAAELATSGTVEASWSGVPATWNLGAISHAGGAEGEDAALLGLTLINVDLRP